MALGEVLPYLEISRETQEVKEIIEMPNVTGIIYLEALKVLKNAGLETKSKMETDTIITDQLPKAGIQITRGTKVILYSN